jgi:hypothetical protein
LTSTTATATSDITPRDLTVSASASAKLYDGNRTASVTLSSDKLSGDSLSLTFATALFDTKNVGTGKTVTVSGISFAGADAGNYQLTSTTASTTANITPRDLTMSASGVNRVYDGTTAATVNLADDALAGDDVADHYAAASFADKNVGAGKTVSVTGISIDGGDAGNYHLTNTTASATADITPRDLTVSASASSRVYDGTRTASVTLSSDKLSGDSLSLSYTSALFDTKDVGTGKTVTVSGISVGGADAGNYQLTSTTATTTANITVRPVTVTPGSGQFKLLGNPDPPLTYTVTSPLGVVQGDAFSGSLSRAPGEAVGSYAITQGTLALNSNYVLTVTPGVLFHIYYRWDGFLQPINDTAHQTGLTESQFKLGSTVPAKFQLKTGGGTVVQAASAPTFTRSAWLGACDPAASTEMVDSDPGFTGSSYRWDSTAQQYIYNWSTKGLKAGEYRIFAVLDDGSGNSANWVDICLR